ncbi:NAD(P)H-quinone oxidoreductase subunit 3 [Candidatus Bathyarchaeota archaeon A05DMB-5]|nr:NAD(P)H-quinone oxidoreductase subunit 3 [Candidatus Bathyarchaeota archaeon A05DMB-5]
MSAKSARDGKGESTYACGEKATFCKLRINVSLYKYLIYFVVLDSSILLVAFASLKLQITSVFLFMLYLSMVLISSFLLFEGGDQ